MLLTKNQIESVRYQLKKLGVNSTNEEIRNSAENFKDFDPELVAQQIVANKTQSLTISDEIDTPSNQSEETNMLALLDNQETNPTTLTTTKKHELVKIKSIELGIDLADTDVVKIADMVAIQIDDTVDFLNEVAVVIENFFITRNTQAKSILDEKIDKIAAIINSRNDDLGDIFNSSNQKLNSIVAECTQVEKDYKSTYQTRLESIREILKLPTF
jgi:hypothetical protein